MKLFNKDHNESYKKNHEAAGNVVRAQINHIYDNKENPYQRTHSQRVRADEEGLKHYHSAWQEYYQKYYEGFYASQQKVDNSFDDTKIKSEIKLKLLSKSNKRINRHFKPIFFGVTTVVLLLTLQYSQLIIGNIYAFIAPGVINPQNIVLNPIKENNVSQESRLIIPKLNIDAPVFYDIGNDFDSQIRAMSKGISHFAVPGASSHPGEKGNTPLAGHSSSGMFSTGDYKFIFAVLERLDYGDVIYANYKSVRYTYIVTRKEIVSPTDINKLVIGEDKPYLTLITCVPVGTANSRLLVFSEQISPNPSIATSTTYKPRETNTMHDTTQTFFDWILGFFRR